MKPLVSILIPAYNAEEWLPETLRSAIAQTWERKEIIVVDDGSKDQTAAIARSFGPNGVKVFTQKNQGAAAARNMAFSLSGGDYIQWLDADDLIGPDKVEKQMQALGDTPNRKILVSGEWGRFLYRPGRAKFVPTGLWCDLGKAEWLIRKMEQNAYMQTASWLVSRELTEAAGPWDTRLLGDDDGEYFCRVLMASEEVRFVPGAKVYYRASGPGSLSYIGNSDKKRDAQWLSMQLHIGYLRSLDDGPRARAACVNFLQNWMVYFYPERLDLFEQANDVAKSLDGQLQPPRLSWKYAWINVIFGWHLARRAQFTLPRLRWSMITAWDRIIYCLERRMHALAEEPDLRARV
jgi:glycosyltransferase involved in cell wall biosynthesis